MTQTNIYNDIYKNKYKTKTGIDLATELVWETPNGDVNGVNTVFECSAVPKMALIDNKAYRDGDGYSRTGNTITVDIAPISSISVGV